LGTGELARNTKETNMNVRTLLLGGAASFAVVVLSAGPMAAQSFPRTSTPQEHAVTETLNAEQASVPGIIIPPADPVAEANYQSALSSHNATVAQQQSQYDAQLKDYQQKNSQYTEQTKTYQDQSASYKAELANPPSVVIVNDPPPTEVIVQDPPTREIIIQDPPPAVVTVAPPVVEERHVLVYPDMSALVHLDALANPDTEIAGVAVEDRFGNLVGHFRHMTFQDQGIEKGVITLHNNKTVAVQEDHLRFDPNHSVVVADLSFDELNRMPARF